MRLVLLALQLRRGTRITARLGPKRESLTTSSTPGTSVRQRNTDVRGSRMTHEHRGLWLQSLAEPSGDLQAMKRWELSA